MLQKKYRITLMKKILINPPIRIHISLLDLSDNGYRTNGGIGFFVSGLTLSVEIELSNSLEFIDNRQLKIPLNFPKTSFLDWLNNHFQENSISHKFKITLSGNTPSHYGFGVSTSVRMSCVEGIYQLLSKKVSNQKIIKQSHRGGTSGIGVHGYFTGGFIFDLGRKINNHQPLPSRSYEFKQHHPLLLKQLPVPNWGVGLLIPNNINPMTNKEEVDFFHKTCPISKDTVYETTYHALFGVLASIESNDFNLFCNAINTLQKQTWKDSERSLYTETSVFEKVLLGAGANAVGMSSLGPSLYFFAENIEAVIENMKQSNLCADVLQVNINNIGRTTQ